MKLKSLSGIIAGVLLAYAGAAQAETVKIGYFPQVHDAANFAIGQRIGDEYEIEYVKFLRYTDAEIALARGDIQLTPIGYATIVGSSLRDPEPRYSVVAGLSRSGISLVCADEVKVETWEDLKGQTVGILPGGPAELFFNDSINMQQVKLSDVNTVAFTAPGPPLLQALRDSTITCMAVYEPFAAIAVKDGYGYYPPLDLAENSFNGINSGLAVNMEFLQANPDFVQKAVDIVVAATEEFNNDAASLEQAVVATGEFQPEVVEISADHLILDTHIYPEQVLTLAQAMEDRGLINKTADPDKIMTYFNYDFLSKATGTPVETLKGGN